MNKTENKPSLQSVIRIEGKINLLKESLAKLKTTVIMKENILRTINEIEYEITVMYSIISELDMTRKNLFDNLKEFQPGIYKDSVLLSERDLFQGVNFIYEDIKKGTIYEDINDGKKISLKKLLFLFSKESSNKNISRIKYNTEEFESLY